MALRKRKTDIETLGHPINRSSKKQKHEEAKALLAEVKARQTIKPVKLRQGEGEFTRELKEQQKRKEKQQAKEEKKKQGEQGKQGIEYQKSTQPIDIQHK